MDIHKEFNTSRLFHEARIDRRAADALVGLAGGLVADGVVNHQEAEFLGNWIVSNLAHLDDPVINILYRRLSDMLSAGILDAEESQELLEMLQGFAGLTTTKPMPSDNSFTPPSELPLSRPAPDVCCEGHVFVFTGVMAFGPRKECEALVHERGGSTANTVSKKVHYLVVGSVGNEQWRRSSYGTKIMKGVELRENGAPIAIINEEHWQRAILG